MLATQTVPNHEVDRNPLPLWLRWNRTSPKLLMESEGKLLQRLKSTLTECFVSIFGGSHFIRTVLASSHTGTSPGKENLPLVLIHGFASGLGLWCKNIDSLAAHRPVYAFDLLGFGRSSRPKFPKDAADVETYWVDSVEEWRSAIQLEKFVLVGHSLGGYISTAYALRYPERVAHLILVDPWGFNEDPIDQTTMSRIASRGLFYRTAMKYVISANPLAALRAIGPLGRRAIHHVRGDLRYAFDQRHLVSGDSVEVPSFEEEAALSMSKSPSTEPGSASPDCRSGSLSPDDLDGSIALDYLYHINVQTPSGEVAFKSLCTQVPWARHPMLERIDQLDRALPITFIFGSRSWMDISSGRRTRDRRPDSYVDIKIIDGAGHQVYAQASDDFNACVNDVCARVDAGDLFTNDPAEIDRSPDAGSQRKPDSDSSSNSSSNSRKRTKRLSRRSSVSKTRQLLCSSSLPDSPNLNRPSPRPGDDSNDEASG